MSTGVRSENAVFHARPRFSIDGADEIRLNEDLLRLECSQDEIGPARFEAVFQNWGRTERNSEVDFMHFDGAILDFGKRIRVEAGDVDNDAIIFEGEITSIEGCYPEGRPPELIVRAENSLQWLRMTKRSRQFNETSDGDIAAEIADDAGLDSEVDATGVEHVALLQVNQSELGLLQERACAADAKLQQQNGVIQFKPRRQNYDEPLLLTRQNELLNVHVNADLAHQRSEVRVHGWSVRNKEAIHATANAETVRGEAENAGRVGAEILSQIHPETTEELHLEIPATVDEAQQLADAKMLRRSRRFITARGVTSGTPRLAPGHKVDLVDLGDWFSGIYHITSVRHTFDTKSGFQTHFLAERNDFGGQ